MKIYDAAIIGLGPSGLAVNKLIYDNKENEVIAFENTDIDKRDNYFGFWLTNWMTPFDELIEKKWNSWEIRNNDQNIIQTDDHHPYCVITYKNWKNFCLKTKNKINLINKKVTKYYPHKNCNQIITSDKKEYFAKKIYDSRTIKINKNEITQQFFGINIITDDHTFNEKKATLMHFTNEKNVLHFIYVLPFKHNRALVESTVFSKDSFSEDWYRKRINEYLNQNSIKKIHELSFEKGIIPMFFLKEKSENHNVINIGVRGGSCKPSTGYAFSFSIRQIQLLKQSKINKVRVHKFLDRIMDDIFLNYLKKNKENGFSFINLAKNLNGNEFQSFMMGQSTLITKLKVIKSMPKIPLIRAMFD